MTRKQTLTKNQAAFVEARAKGISRDQSAIIATGTDDNASRLESAPIVKDELARIRAETAKNCGVTKEDVVQMLLDAGQMAKLTGEATALVATARELGKMLGFYAVEVKKTLHGVDEAQLKRVLSELSDEELFKMAKAPAIEGTCERITEKDV